MPASLSGIVVTDGVRPAPVRRAIVTLAGAELSRPRSTVTDEAGRFSFPDLPPGRFTLTAAKRSFVTNAYGARRPGRAGTPLTVASGQQLRDLSVTLPRGAVVTGTIRDQNGEPSVNMIVRAVPFDQVRSVVPALVFSGDFMTDDRGIYRVFGLPPGDYAIAATPRNSLINSMGIMSTAQVDAALRELQQSRGRPGGAGASANAGATPPSTTPLRNDPVFANAPVFYPGTPIAADAAKITVATGEERAGVDFQFKPARTASVAGVLSSPDGVLPSVAMSIDPEGLGANSSMMLGLTGPQRPGPDGKFKFTGVTPGRYRVTVRTAAPPNPPGLSRGAGPGPPPAPSGPVMWAAAEVAVDGENIDGLALTLQPALKFSGRVQFDATSLTPPADLTKLLVQLFDTSSLSALNRLPANAAPPAPLRADGTFDMSGLLPGTYRPAVVLATSSGWWLRSVIVNGTDVLDTGLEFGPGGDIAGAVFTFTDRHSELSGTLQTPAGSPAPEFFVVAFPADRALWRPQARRIQSTRPGTDGKFILADLPAGDYLLAALVDIDPQDLNDPKFLEQVLTAAIRVTVADGEKKTQDLRIAR